MGRILILVVFASAFLLLFSLVTSKSSKEVLAAIRTRGTIVMGVLGDMPPFGEADENGIPHGFEVDLAGMIGESVLGGKGVVYLSVNAKTARAYLDNGDCDILVATVVVNSVNEEKYNLTAPYAAEDVQLLSKTGNVVNLQSSGTVIGVIRGSNAKNVLTAYLKANYMAATVMEIASYPDAVDAIGRDNITALCAARSVLDRYVKTGISVYPITVGYLNYAVAVRKSETDLFEAAKEALGAIKKDGRLNDLYGRYRVSAPIN